MQSSASQCMLLLVVRCAELEVGHEFREPWPLICPASSKVIEGQMGCSNCCVIMLIFAELVACGYIVLGQGHHYNWSLATAAVGLSAFF